MLTYILYRVISTEAMLKPIDVEALGADDDLQIIGTKTYTYSIKDIVDVLLNATIPYSSTIKDIVDVHLNSTSPYSNNANMN